MTHVTNKPKHKDVLTKLMKKVRSTSTSRKDRTVAANKIKRIISSHIQHDATAAKLKKIVKKIDPKISSSTTFAVVYNNDPLLRFFLEKGEHWNIRKCFKIAMLRHKNLKMVKILVEKLSERPEHVHNQYSDYIVKTAIQSGDIEIVRYIAKSSNVFNFGSFQLLNTKSNTPAAKAIQKMAIRKVRKAMGKNFLQGEINNFGTANEKAKYATMMRNYNVYANRLQSARARVNNIDRRRTQQRIVNTFGTLKNAAEVGEQYYAYPRILTTKRLRTMKNRYMA